MKPIPPTSQLPGQHAAFMKLRAANLEVERLRRAIPEGTPADCAAPDECSLNGVCLYQPCSHRTAVVALVQARARRDAAVAEVNSLILAGQQK
jgi:hypothetical protein